MPKLTVNGKEVEVPAGTNLIEAARAAGIEEPPPRLAAESMTAPVVRAVAFGAGARRAIARFTADVAPLGKTRKVVTMASRVSAPRRNKEAK